MNAIRWLLGHRPSLALSALVVLTAGGAAAAATQDDIRVGQALTRPAVLVSNPTRTVMLGAARAGNRLIAVGERGVILLSDDDGQHWRQADVPVSVTLTAVRFIDASHGMATGHGGVVLATSDGGATWSKVLDGVMAASIVKTAAGSDEHAIRDAERLVADGADKPFLDLAVFDARKAVVVGAYGLAFETQDGGQSWDSIGNRLPNPKGLHLYAIRAYGASLWIVGEQGLVLHSADGGTSFQAVDAGYAGSWFTVELPSEHEVLIAGLKGHVRRSVDDGANWTPVELPVPSTVTASWLDSNGQVLLASQAGTAFSERAGRATATSLQLPPLNAIAPIGQGRVLALTMQGLTVQPLVTVPDGISR